MRSLLAKVIVLLALAAGGGQASSSNFEIMAEFEQRPGNPAVAPDGSVFVSMHPFDSPDVKVVRIAADGTATPFPNDAIARSFAAVIGIAATRDGVLWILDMGGPDQSAKLFGWHTGEDRLEAIHYLPREVGVPNSFYQDLAIDQTRRRVFIADMSRADLVGESRPGIVVVDLDTGAMLRRLDSHPFLQPKSDHRAEGRTMTFTAEGKEPQTLRLGLNPIGIDEDDRFVYFSTIAPGPVYRVAAARLGDPALSDAEIVRDIEIFGSKPTSDGIAVAGETVYVTDVDSGAIRALDKTGLRAISEDPRLIWPDAIALDPEGGLVVTVNQLNRAPPFNGGVSGAEPPYLLVRIRSR